MGNPFLALKPKTELESIADYVRVNEGINWKVEPDVRGHDTIGRGHKVKPGEDFSYLANLPRDQKIDEFDRIFEQDIVEHTERARAIFPQFDNYPIDIKQALVDGTFRGDHHPGFKTTQAINESRWKDVPANYIDRDDYRASKASATSEKPWTGVQKRLDRNNKIFKKYAGADWLIDKGQRDFLHPRKESSFSLIPKAFADDNPFLTLKKRPEGSTENPFLAIKPATTPAQRDNTPGLAKLLHKIEGGLYKFLGREQPEIGEPEPDIRGAGIQKGLEMGYWPSLRLLEVPISEIGTAIQEDREIPLAKAGKSYVPFTQLEEPKRYADLLQNYWTSVTGTETPDWYKQAGSLALASGINIAAGVTARSVARKAGKLAATRPATPQETTALQKNVGEPVRQNLRQAGLNPAKLSDKGTVITTRSGREFVLSDDAVALVKGKPVRIPRSARLKPGAPQIPKEKAIIPIEPGVEAKPIVRPQITPKVAPVKPGAIKKTLVEAKPKAPEVKEPVKGITISKDDIPYNTAYHAYQGISFSPEKRAETVRKNYVDDMTDIVKELESAAKSPAQKEILKEELLRFKNGYIAKYTRWLNAKGQTISPMITGPANFPVARNQKRMASEMKRLDEFTEWKEKAINSIEKKLNKVDIQEQGGELEVLKKKLSLEEKNQAMMKEANKILRKKGLTADQQKTELTKIGFEEKAVDDILKPDFAGRKGFPSFQLTNINARIKGMKSRVAEMEKAESLSGQQPIGKAKGIEVVNNFDEERVQILFDTKPSPEIISRLKSSGWRWSPRNKAWQRKNTRNGISSAEQFLRDQKPKIDIPKAGGMVQKLPSYVKKIMDKGVTVTGRGTPIRMDESVTVTDIRGKKIKLPEGHEFTPFTLSNGKIWLHDGKNLVVDRSQIEKLKHSPATSVLSGYKKPKAEIKNFDNFETKEDRIAVLEKEANVVNGQRLSGKITADEANKKIKEINKQKLDYAKEKGIAITQTPGGKTRIGIRRSGFYAKEQIVGEPTRDVYSQFQPPSSMALMQDGFKKGGKFGTIYNEVWLPTKKSIADSTDLKNKFDTQFKRILKKHNFKITKKNGDLLSGLLEKKVDLPGKYQPLVDDVRNFLNQRRDEANAVREAMGKSKIGYIQDYVPHLQKTSIWQELIGNNMTITDNFDFIIPNQVRNPFAHKRLMEEIINPERNFFSLIERYNSAIAKDIHINPAIENIKVYNTVLKDKELLKSAKYWDEYIRQGLLGKQHKIDSSLNISPLVRKGLKKWKDVLNKAFLTGKLSWNIATQPLSYITLTPTEAGFVNAVKAPFKMFNKGIRKTVREKSQSLKIKSKDVLSDAIGEGRGYANRIYRTKIYKWNDMLSVISSVEEQLLHEASYIAGLGVAQKLGYTGEDAHKFADLTAERTQSMYNKENRALILNSDLTTGLIPFQSFAVELSNHAKEILSKSSGAMKLTIRQRIGKLLRLLIGIWLANKYSKSLTGRAKTTFGTFIPFVGELMDRAIIRAHNVIRAKQGRKEVYEGGRSPFSPIQQAEALMRASKDFIKHGDTRRLRQIGITFSGALFGAGGGGQISNIVDGIIGDINEEVKSASGKVLFKIEDLKSKIKAPIFGVWSTEGGRDYWDQRLEENEIPSRRRLLKRRQKRTRRRRTR